MKAELQLGERVRYAGPEQDADPKDIHGQIVGIEYTVKWDSGEVESDYVFSELERLPKGAS